MRFLILSLSLLAVPAAAEERRVMVTTFEAMRVDGPFEVTVRTGASPTVVASGDPRALDGIDIQLEDRVLVVRGNPGGWGGWPDARMARPVITVTTPRLSSATLNGAGKLTIGAMRGADVSLAAIGSGRIDVARVEADRLSATLAGSGQIALGGSVRSARFTNSGVGSIAATALSVRDLTVQSQSAGDSSFTATETANVVATGIGGVEVAGPAACTATGPAPIRCGR